MRLAITALLALALVAQIVNARLLHSQEWTKYKRDHGKVYDTPEEDSRRFALFLAAKEKIQRHNAQDGSYKLGLNHLSDWSHDEFQKLNGVRYNLERVADDKIRGAMHLERLFNISDPLPETLDWRQHPNRVTSVKDQGNCSSDWAFSTVGVLEGQVILRTKLEQLESLSAQNLIDCVHGAQGCDGGFPVQALVEISKEGGIMADKDYPYAAKRGECHFAKQKSVITDNGYQQFLLQNEGFTKKAVATFGPISISLSSYEWQHYSSGVFDNPDCMSKQPINHAVLLVGYGTDPKLGDYWIVKNSWSEKWGESGYMRMKRGALTCGAGLVNVVPTFAYQ